MTPESERRLQSPPNSAHHQNIAIERCGVFACVLAGKDCASALREHMQTKCDQDTWQNEFVEGMQSSRTQKVSGPGGTQGWGGHLLRTRLASIGCGGSGLRPEAEDGSRPIFC